MVSQQNISYIPLDQAARKYGVSQKVLRQRADSGKLPFAKLPNGDLLVADHGIDPSLNIKREDFKHLRGRKINMSEASQKYGVPRLNFTRWTKAGYVTVLGRSREVLLDEADAAYCAAVYRAKYDFYDGQMSGVRIFDKKGNPYQIKYREVAAMMREERRKTREREIS